MRKSLSLLVPILAVGLFVIVQSAAAAPKTEPAAAGIKTLERTKDGALAQREVQVLEIIATIQKLDIKDRMITLKGPEGTVTFKVSPKVTRLAEFKTGDKVVVQHFESLAFEVRPPTAAERENPRVVVEAAGKFTKDLPPGVEAGMVSHTIVTIEAINLTTNMVTFKLPEGDSVSIKAKYPENLKRVKVGDTVAVTYAKAIAIKIVPFKG